MKKAVLTLICLMAVSGCAGIDDAVFGGARRNAQRIEERHQMLMKLYSMRIDPNATATELATIDTYISEIEAQQRHEQLIKTLNELKWSRQLNYQQKQQRLQEIQWQLDEMEHKASFDRMRRGGLP